MVDLLRNGSGKARHWLLACGLLFGLCLVSFWPTLHNGFVGYDDPDYVTSNVHVLRGLSGENIAWALWTKAAGNWHPLTWVSHMADVELWGLTPGGHHLTSLVWHTVNSILVLLLLRNITGAFWRSVSVAVLFAVHPLHVESVAWVAERKDVLSTFSGLLCLLCYAAYANRKCAGPAPQTRTSVGTSGMAFYALACLCLALGLMSKPMLVTWPFVMLLLDYWPLGRIGKHRLSQILLEKVPFLLLALGSCVVTYSVQSSGGAVSSLEALPLGFRISNAIVSYVRYLGRTLWPQDLAVLYPLPQDYSWPLALVLGATAVLLVITVVAWRNRFEGPYLLVGWLWFLGTLVPVIGLVQVGQQAMADRYTYIPLIGVFLMLAWGISDAVRAWRAARKLLPIAAALATAVCALLTFEQTKKWQSGETLFSHAIKSTSNNAIAHNNLGSMFLDKGRFLDAEPHFVEALRIRPGYAEALTNLGLVRQQQGRTAEAVELLRRAIGTRASAAANYNLGNLLAAHGTPAEAETYYLAALKIKPEFPEAMYNLGSIQAKLGKVDAALESYQSALRMQPRNEQIRLSLGALLAQTGRIDDAIAQFSRIVKDSPQNPDARFNLAAALQAKGALAEAIIQYREVCRLRPEDRDARQKLGFGLLLQGRPADAAREFSEALKQNTAEAVHSASELAQLHYYLALAMHSQGQLMPALSHYREATRLNPNAPAFLNDLAWILATDPAAEVRNGQEAVALAEKACALSKGREPRFWGTLDAAIAETGDFEKAISTANKTKVMAEAAGQKEIAQAADERISNYRVKQPYRAARPVATSE